MPAQYKWKVRHPRLGRTDVDFSGFSSDASALKHTLKHFLSPEEAWEQCRPPKMPAEFIDTIQGQGGEPGTDEIYALSEQGMHVLEQAADSYQLTVKKVNSSENIYECEKLRERSFGDACELTRLYIVSNFGVFSVFSYRKNSGTVVSELITSFRPGSGGAKKRMEWYLFASSRKLARKVKAASRGEEKVGPWTETLKY